MEKLKIMDTVKLFLEFVQLRLITLICQMNSVMFYTNLSSEVLITKREEFEEISFYRTKVPTKKRCSRFMGQKKPVLAISFLV